MMCEDRGVVNISSAMWLPKKIRKERREEKETEKVNIQNWINKVGNGPALICTGGVLYLFL